MFNFIIVTIACFSFIFSVYNIGIVDVDKKKIVKNFIIVDLFMIPIANINVSLGMPIMFLISFLLLYFDNKRLFLNIINCIFATIIVFISDGLVASIAIPIIGEEFYTAMEIPRFKIMVHIGMLIIVIIITQVVRLLIRKFKINPENIKIKNKMTILMIVNICIIAITYYLNAIVAQTYMARNTTMLIYVALMIVYLISMSVITFVVANNMKKEMQYENRKIELENLKEYNSNLEAMYNDMRGFRHDYTNILTAMSGYIEEKNIEGLEEFFYKKIVPLNSEMNRKNNRIGLLQNIHITEIKGLIASKVIRAQELGIDVLVDIVEPVDKIDMDIIDLSRTIGILLDNAIEAAIECEKSWIKLTFIQKENFVLLVFINSCVERTPQIYRIFEKGFLTKGDNRGLGLYNLKEIVNKYHTISLDTKADKGEFTQVLQISNS
ncbi:sensor histidine kinase [Clostridium intestinale]|uniref:GHKL domain-containing protein n=1 Tax=Clostridium intestinale TaxID=36845 RepID=A0A7D6ZHX8_9CLOT|nr:GHKL domain-containing protein [Clostridium intestinale]QLY80901.1 GHKL domain-containing protein [Clostridium intestinale]